MRWIMRAAGALCVLWLVYAASPYMAAYRLVTAVQTRDVEALRARVSFRAVRVSLAKQIVAAYLNEIEGGRPSTANRQIAGALIDLADPLIAQLLTPEVLFDLLEDGWPQSVVPDTRANDAPAVSQAGPAGAAGPMESSPGLGLPRLTWRDLLRLVDMRGFRKFYLTLPGVGGIVGTAGSIRFYFRLDGWRWRLYEIELPDVLARRLAGELLKRVGRKP